VLNAVLRILGILGLVAAAALETYFRMQSFEGELCVAQGGVERVAVQIADTRSWIVDLRSRIKDWGFKETLVIQREVHPDDIPFEDPGAAVDLLDSRMTYDAVRLPFVVQLKNIAVLDKPSAECRLQQVSPRGQQETAFAIGAEVLIGEEPFKVEAIRKWSGLFRDPNGMPMAALSVRHPGLPWTEHIFLAAGTWRRIESPADSHVTPNGGADSGAPGLVGIYFNWFESENLARKALDAGRPGIESARWGVVDGVAVNWFESFAPGTGTRLSDGTSVTLLQLDEEHDSETGARPAIEVEIQEDGAPSAVWVAANQPDANGRVCFEYPARLDNVVLLYGYPGGMALAAAYCGQDSAADKTLHVGETWSVKGLPFELRLDQARAHTVPVEPENSPLYEAVLVSPTTQLRLRQGEAVRHNDVQLEFIRTQPPPSVRYDLALTAANGPERTFSISPDETVTFGSWSLSQAPPAPNPTQTAVLHIVFIHNRTWLKLILASSLAALVWSVLHSRREETTTTSN